MDFPGGIVREVKEKALDAEHGANQVTTPLTRRLGTVDFLKKLFAAIGENHTGAFAGNLAYNALFAIFPFLLFLLSLLGVFHATSLVDTLINRAASAMPADAVRLLRTTALGITKSQATGAMTVGALISMLLALWGVSGAFRAVMEAMNVSYGVKDSRAFWKQYAISIGLAIGATGLLIAALILVVFGPAIGGWVAGQIGLGLAFQWVWNILQWPVLLAFVLLAFALVYYFAPDVEQEFRFISPGSIGGVTLWLVFSLLFSLYVNNFGSYNKTYGAIAGLIIFLLYMYYSAFILLVGAEANQIIEKYSPGGKQKGQRGAPADDGESRTLAVLRENRPAG